MAVRRGNAPSQQAVAAKATKQRAASGSGLLAHIEAAEQQAHRDGFHVTAHALNRAKNACGWEIAGDILAAGAAARGTPKTRIRIAKRR